MEFHGTDTSSSMEFHGTWSAPISMTRAVPWNSVEFHGIRSAPISLTQAVPWNSMEFHGTSSVPISLTRAVPWNSMEFHGAWSAPISMTRAVPWNSIYIYVRMWWECWPVILALTVLPQVIMTNMNESSHGCRQFVVSNVEFVAREQCSHFQIWDTSWTVTFERQRPSLKSLPFANSGPWA